MTDLQKKLYQVKKISLSFVLFSTFLVILSGCQSPKKPRLRVGAYFGAPTGMPFPEPDKIGSHRFVKSSREKNGMVYTCRAGFIDIGHVREAADRAAYVQSECYRNIMENQKHFSYQVIEPSHYHVTLTYPDDWSMWDNDDQKEIAREVSIQMGQSFAHTSLIWHEMLTWFGFSSMGIFPENISSFSWEDPYSDLLGTQLAAQAMRDNQKRFDDAMTELIGQTLETLEVQPAAVARRAAKRVGGEWFTGGFYFFVDMKKRNFDVGLDDGQVTPWLVPGICPDAEPLPCLKPNLEILTEHGFEVTLEIRPIETEKAKIYRILKLDGNQTIQPAVHFPVLLEAIIKQAVETYGPDVQKPTLKEFPL